MLGVASRSHEGNARYSAYESTVSVLRVGECRLGTSDWSVVYGLREQRKVVASFTHSWGGTPHGLPVSYFPRHPADGKPQALPSRSVKRLIFSSTEAGNPGSRQRRFRGKPATKKGVQNGCP